MSECKHEWDNGEDTYCVNCGLTYEAYEEIERLKEENARLVRERDEARAQVEDLQKVLSEASKVCSNMALGMPIELMSLNG